MGQFSPPKSIWPMQEAQAVSYLAHAGGPNRQLFGPLASPESPKILARIANRLAIILASIANILARIAKILARVAKISAKISAEFAENKRQEGQLSANLAPIEEMAFDDPNACGMEHGGVM